MAATQLDELYVQLSTRGLTEAMADVKALQERLKEARPAADKLRESFAKTFRLSAKIDSGSVLGAIDAVIRFEDSLLSLRNTARDPITPKIDTSAIERATRDVLEFEAALARVAGANNLPTAQRIPTAQRLQTARRMANPIPVLDRWRPPVATPAAAQQAQRVIPVRVTNASLLVRVAGGGGGAGGPGRFADPAAFGDGARKAASAMDVLRDKVRAFARVAQVGFAAGTAGVLGLARAGFAETVEGYRFGLQMKFLSQQVAALFVPALNKATELLEQLVNWFRQLDGEGQKNVRNMALLGLGATGLAAVLPKAVGMMTGLAGGAAQLATSLGMSAAAAGPIGVAVAAVAVTLATWAALFAVAYARSSELRASVTRLGTVLFDAFAKVKPLVLFLLDAMGRGLAFSIDLLATHIEFAANLFVSVWNVALQQVSAEFVKMARVMGVLADKLPAGKLKDFAEGARGAFLDAAIAARQLKLDPNAKGGPGGGRLPIPTPMNIGTESAEQSFQRFQQAVYKLGTGKDAQEQAVDQLKEANKHLQAIAGKGDAKQPPPPNAAGGGALAWAV
jgi:hypothetical protein